MVQKSIIIDFDHTIGYFNQFVFILNIVETTYNILLNETQICNILDHFPLVFRPKLYDIFELILLYEKEDKITFFILYTCNNKPHFVRSIVHYLEGKLNRSSIFREIVFEPTNTKNIHTLLNHMNENNHFLCFIDNTLFEYRDKKVITRYIKSEKYIYNYEIREVIRLFPYNLFNQITETLLRQYLRQYLKNRKNKKRRILPYRMYEFNSSFILQSINDFVSTDQSLLVFNK
tara:strand:+ start:606 stop:1301 length:696 start_codon:yes stop_codon:yes gene_type:complete